MDNLLVGGLLLTFSAGVAAIIRIAASFDPTHRTTISALSQILAVPTSLTAIYALFRYDGWVGIFVFVGVTILMSLFLRSTIASVKANYTGILSLASALAGFYYVFYPNA